MTASPKAENVEPLDAAFLAALPAELFDMIPEDARAKAAVVVDDVFATLPDLPSVEGFAKRLDDVQVALDAARAEADGVRAELHHKAQLLRQLADALDAI